MRAYCGALGLPFIAESLSWDDDSLPAEWMHVAGWHGDLAGSTGMGKVDQKQASLDGAPRLQEFLDHHMPFLRKVARVPPPAGN